MFFLSVIYICGGGWHAVTQISQIDYAITSNNFRAVERVVSSFRQSVDVDSLGDVGATPLLYATDRRVSFRIFEYLVKKGAKLTSLDMDGFSISQWICMGNKTDELVGIDYAGIRPEAEPRDQVKKLELVRRVSPSQLRYTSGGKSSPLELAVKFSNAQLVHYLVGYGVFEKEILGWANNADLIRYLLARGGVVASNDPTHVPLLHCAMETSDPKAVHLLLSAGADPNVVSWDGRTTPAMALSVNPFLTEAQRIEILKDLVKFGLNLTYADSLGNCPLSFAIFNGRVRLARELIKLHAAAGLSLRVYRRLPIEDPAKRDFAPLIPMIEALGGQG